MISFASPAARFRSIAFVESLSFLFLLLIAMPLKYGAGWPYAVRVGGWLHGVLFVTYLIFMVEAALAGRWRMGKIALALLASVLPFGYWLLKKE